jgi:hypothetical protein
MKTIRLTDEQVGYLYSLAVAEEQFDEESRHICEEDTGGCREEVIRTLGAELNLDDIFATPPTQEGARERQR